MATRFSRGLTVFPSVGGTAVTAPAPAVNATETLNKLIAVRVALMFADLSLPAKRTAEDNKLIDALLAKGGTIDAASILSIDTGYNTEINKLDALSKAIASLGAAVEKRIREIAQAQPAAAAEVAQAFRRSLEAEIAAHNDKLAALKRIQAKITELLSPYISAKAPAVAAKAGKKK
jgi:hypothetical protein